jgi:hypothetical protein
VWLQHGGNIWSSAWGARLLGGILAVIAHDLEHVYDAPIVFRFLWPNGMVRKISDGEQSLPHFVTTTVGRCLVHVGFAKTTSGGPAIPFLPRIISSHIMLRGSSCL